ncbi:MAG: hypothetical protein Q7J44_15915 [Pseudotabrizicola sp.]|uniref:hypothetical protein n=1 Tax=Pseudotabrizicola sp. TaxID=2939647 RepID=UPI002723C8DB|nr:hypothetical protein [Pseudotabrizicola sp.]MDO9640024.1 hypothetical protein [Pseudotabrizicola sp.]
MAHSFLPMIGGAVRVSSPGVGGVMPRYLCAVIWTAADLARIRRPMWMIRIIARISRPAF